MSRKHNCGQHGGANQGVGQPSSAPNTEQLLNLPLWECTCCGVAEFSVQPPKHEGTPQTPSEPGQITIAVDGVPVEVSPALIAVVADEIRGITADPAKRRVKRHLRCPTCYGNYGGVAVRRKWQRQVSGPLQKRCYVCGECGTEWVADVRSEIVDDIEIKTTRVVEVRPGAAGE